MSGDTKRGLFAAAINGTFSIAVGIYFGAGLGAATMYFLGLSHYLGYRRGRLDEREAPKP